MEVHAVETVIELIRCGFSTDLEGTLFPLYLLYDNNLKNIWIWLFLEKYLILVTKNNYFSQME